MTETKATAVKYQTVNAKGEKGSDIALNPAIFGAPVKSSIVHDTVVWQLAKRRSGTHSTLTRSKMIGGNTKPFKQKGTGRARAGSTVSPLWVGGAVVHGPQPRDYTTRVPVRTRRQALCSVLSEKVRNEQLLILDELPGQNGKTADVAKALKNLGVVRGGATIVIDGGESSSKIEQAVRNLTKITPITVAGLNVYDVLRNQFLICSRAGVEQIEARIVKSTESKTAKVKKGSK